VIAFAAVRTPVTNQSALWLGAISLGYGLFTLVKTPGRGPLILALCAFGLLMLVFGIDGRRLWKVREASIVGAIVGAFVAAMCLMVGGRDVLAILTVIGCVGVSAGIAAAIEWSDRRLVAKLVRAHRAGQPVEPFAIAAVRTSRRVVFEVAFLLVEWGRFDIVEQLAMHSFVPNAESLRRFYLALALHARGKFGEAMDLAKTTNHLDHGPFVREQWEQLVARIQVSNGEAAEVIAKFSPQCPVNHPALAVERKLVLADAHTVSGNLDIARRIVETVAAPLGVAFLERLKQHPRPTSIIATSLLARSDAPYR
jgi:uncharacterized protein (DUF697 family)